MKPAGKLPLTLASAAVVMLGVSTLVPLSDAHAQQIYRSVGPDGKVTFSDQPPAASPTAPAARGRTTTTTKPSESPSTGGDAAASSSGTLPYALQQIVNRYPVTIYTSEECTPCSSARNLLLTRGVPFTERTVNNNESLEALKSLSGVNNVPFATIGGQHLQGFSDTVWTQYLDAAGYPKQTQLPSNYRRPAATPLAAAKEVEPQAPVQARPAARPAPAPAPETTTPSGPTPSNPAGIVF